MSYYFTIDQALTRNAKEKLVKMLRQKPFMERWEPIQTETQWVINGRPNATHHKKILPEYCYNILELQRRTIYKVFSPISQAISFKSKKKALKCKTVREAKKCMTIDWEKMGSVFAMGERVQMFYQNELQQTLKRDGFLNLKKKGELELLELVCGDRWIKNKIAELKDKMTQPLAEKIPSSHIEAATKMPTKAVTTWHERAREWSPEAVTQYHTGVTKGSDGFLDKNGELKGEKKIKLRETYDFLLIAWPEIQEMLKADPPKTRNHLWEWLKAFSYAKWIEIEDLEQLNRLCNEMKIKLKKPGAPRKTK
jgi:hypothetical protein